MAIPIESVVPIPSEDLLKIEILDAINIMNTRSVIHLEVCQPLAESRPGEPLFEPEPSGCPSPPPDRPLLLPTQPAIPSKSQAI